MEIFIVFSLGHIEDYWHKIRSNLCNKLLAHPAEYAVSYDTAIRFANRYCVTVHYLNKEGSTMWFPLWYDMKDIPNHAYVVFVHVHGNHYVIVDLQETYPMPTVLSYLRKYILELSA
uniref:Uncharacterized protein n=1 Tax=Lactuca sativa TaxID=4236 RepID=A0A9R1VNP1_LACSA|nr:hypothetical protein LSAT_V11C500257160 [Lactuca sativa]